MFSSLYNAVLEWNRTTNERQKLQHIYFTIIVVSVVVCGIVSLIDSQTGQDLLVVPLVAALIFLANALIWSLVESVFISRLSGRRKK